jgi:hypothetical protein
MAHRGPRPFHFTHVPYLVGQFQLAGGRTAVLINNHDDRSNMVATVVFRNHLNQSYQYTDDESSSLLLEVSPQSGREGPVHDDCLHCPGLQLLLQAGSGRLIILPAAGVSVATGEKKRLIAASSFRPVNGDT